jgi:hypothetical protein
MYVETWQILCLILITTSAYFSYKQGRKDGVASGVHVTISDLHSKGIVAIYQDDLNGEMVVGRYDEIDFDNTDDDVIGEDEDHW